MFYFSLATCCLLESRGCVGWEGVLVVVSVPVSHDLTVMTMNVHIHARSITSQIHVLC